MNVYKLLFAVVLFCVLNEGLAWWGGRSSSSSRGGSSGSSSSRRSSGWWGRRRNEQPKPAPKPQPKPVPAPAPKPSPGDSGKHNSGWWFSRRRNQQPKPAPNPIIVPETKPVFKHETDMKKVIKHYEGNAKTTAYDAQPNNPKVHDTTIGIGFNLNRPDAKKTFEKVVPGVDFNKVKSGQQAITKDQAQALFDHDVDNIYEPRARNKVGKDVYDKLPSNVKTAVVNAVYRGDLGPKTANLMKQGKWDQVGKEYLDHQQYKNADKLGIPGVKTRMDWNKKQFDTMIKKNNK